jgi:hypothetical protein
MSLVKSKQRVSDHGAVFTPAWMVESMLDLVKEQSELKYGKSDFERQHYPPMTVRELAKLHGG